GLYQPGWRLGGKAASGRNPDQGSRIEELGPHVWGGFYDNAFRLVQRCYAELDRKPGAPLSSWQEAFLPHDSIVVGEHVQGTWRPWVFRAPRTDTLPGAPTRPTSIWAYLAKGMERVSDLWDQLREARKPGESDDEAAAAEWAQKWVNHVAEFTKHLEGAIEKT